MRYFRVEPEVAGGLGPRTELDTSTFPPIVSKLNYQFDGWLGDVLITSFPSFVVTEAAQQALETIGASGASFDSIEITTSDEFEDFEELRPRRVLPSFRWMKIHGTPGTDDIGLTEKCTLVVSDRVLRALIPLGISNAVVQPLEE
ncbi:MAG: hypothetical protein HYR85_21030 [Planctomycetes bacterium]|nr:hypothetical protein [Planctomycetota bacterium]MBI3847029.1 hypothetical protein [Planctomycetota bacterium]